jgi:hypothetical protein
MLGELIRKFLPVHRESIPDRLLLLVKILDAGGKMPRPNPLDPGNIQGQNPSTPERLPGHTSDIPVRGQMDGNEEELGGKPAFLFGSGELLAVSLDSSGANLPAAPSGQWQLVRYFTLGVRDPGIDGVNPEVIISGIHAQGFYLWKPSLIARGEPTGE